MKLSDLSKATTERLGKVEKATTAEALAGTVDKFPDAAGVQSAIVSGIDSHETTYDHTSYDKAVLKQKREALLKEATLTLDFANNTYEVYEGPVDGLTQRSFKDVLNFTRGSAATARNATGGITDVLTDEQRLVGNREGLLIEEQRTNLQVWSEDFTSGAYSSSRVSVDPDTTIAPDGKQTADTINLEVDDSYFTTTTGSAAPIPPDTTGVLSFYILDNPVGLIVQAVNGSGTDLPIPTRTVLGESYSEWKRVILPFTSGPDGLVRCVIRGKAGAVKLWGLQIEQGSFPTSYIKTEGTQVTRVADICSRTLGAEFNASEGTFVFSFMPKTQIGETGFLPFAQVGTGSSDINDRLFQVFRQVSTEQYGVTLYESGASIEMDPAEKVHVAVSFSLNEPSRNAVAMNGQTSIGSSLPRTLTGLRMIFCRQYHTISQPDQTSAIFQNVVYIPRALSEQELIALTTPEA